MARRIAALYAIVVGVLMIGQWIMFIATGQVPEFDTKQIGISFRPCGTYVDGLNA
jgi:hypothetical protein